jgi:C-terminal processing protease CtpA/Prc
MSAAEIFADKMLNLENTLIIGQNTAGFLIAPGNVPYYLPNSGIPFVAGIEHFMHPAGNFYEGIGIAPDVWVIGDALTAALAMVNDL